MYQKITIVGNVGKDAEMRYTPAGKPVTSFSVATSHQYTATSGEKIKETVWFRVTVWGKLAEVCNQYVKKGNSVLVDGRLQSDAATGGPRVWTKQDGTPSASFEINAETVKFLGGAKGQASGTTEETDHSFGAPEDDIPF